MPSARILAQTAQGEASRERQLVYAVGYKETCQVDILGGGVWKWRRVVFTFKGDWLYGGDVTWTEPYYDKSTDPASTDMARLIAQPTPISTTALRPSCGMEEKESIGLQSSPPRWTRHALPRSTTARSRSTPQREWILSDFQNVASDSEEHHVFG